MNKKDLLSSSNEALISAFYWVTIKGVHEENSKGGATKGTAKAETDILNELAKRFNLDMDALNKMIHK